MSYADSYQDDSRLDDPSPSRIGPLYEYDQQNNDFAADAVGWTNDVNTASQFLPATQLCDNLSTTTPADLAQPDLVYKLVVDVYIAGALCLAGFLGNALSVAVLYRDREKPNTTNWLLQTLAFVDIVYLAACVFIQPIKTIHDMTDWLPAIKHVFPYIEPHIWGVGSIAQTATVWLVLLVTVDRYIAVCMPLQRQWRSLARAKVAVAVLLVVACLYNIPRFLEREFLFKTDCATGSTVVLTQRTHLRKDKNYFLVYKTICYFIFRAIGPLTTLVLLNVRLIRALHVIRRRHKDMNKNKNKRTKHRENITAMIVVVVTVFIVCELPDLGIRIAFTVSEFGWVTLDVLALRYANSISNTLLAVNSSSNFLIYCLVGKKFRRILLEMVACKNSGASGFGSSGTETTVAAAYLKPSPLLPTGVGPGSERDGAREPVAEGVVIAAAVVAVAQTRQDGGDEKKNSV